MRPSGALLVALALAGCGPKPAPPAPAAVSSSASLYLRNTFDTDPSVYLGRFVPAGVLDLDESNAMSLACSKHISYRFIDGGGVAYSETLNVGTEVGTRLGIPQIADANVSVGTGRVAQAQYVLTGKMVAEIKDPDAFAACCKAQPDQCSDRYIGEFVQGTGALYHSTKVDTKGNVTATVAELAGASAGVDLATSSEWKRAAEFPNPVYFAFKTTRTPYSQGAVQTCPSWVDSPPQVPGGTYVVGGAEGQRSEQTARDAALKSANGMALRAAGLNPMLLAGGTLALRAESWCVTPRTDARGTRYDAKVLAFVSDEAVATAKTEAAARMAAAEAEAARLDAQMNAPTQPAAAQPAPAYPAQPAPAYPAQPAQTYPAAPTQPYVAPAQPAGPVGASAGADAARILAAVSAESFAADRMSALRSASAGARLTCREAAGIVKLMNFSSDMLAAVEVLRPTIVDPQNWEEIVGVFSFSADKDKVRALRP